MVEGAAAVAVKPARLLKPELKSEGVKSREVARLGSNIISGELDKVNQEIAGKTDKERFDIVTGHKGKRALKSAEGWITNKKDYTNGQNDKHDPEGDPAIDLKDPNNPNDRPMWIMYEGRACKITHIKKTNGDTIECRILDQNTGRRIAVPTEDVIKAQLVAEAENILSLLQGPEREVTEAFLKSIDVRNPVDIDIADSTIIEAANARNLPTVETLKKAAEVILAEKTIPADASKEVEDQIKNENKINGIRREQINNLTGNLADHEQIMDLVRSDPGYKDFPIFIKSAEIRIGQLKYNLANQQIGQPTMIDGVQTIVTQKLHDQWKLDLKAKEAEVKMLKEAMEGGEELLGTYLRKNENNEIKPDRAARIKTKLERGDIQGIMKEAIDQFDEEAQAQGEQALNDEQKKMKMKIMLEAVKKYTPMVGGIVAVMLIFGLMQNSKQGG